jgi:NSS family neurotransmitter:Na+ symporter
MKSRIVWKSSYAFYLAAIGSSFGLGNLWRFPYVVGSNGGGAFVLMYIVLALLVGLPVLIAELMLGQSTQRSCAMAFAKSGLKNRFSHPRIWRGFGWLSNAAVVLLISYYAVVSGWVFFFFLRFVGGVFNFEPFRLSRTFSFLMEKGWLQFLMSVAHLAVAGFIVSKGFRDGLERWVGFIMPVFGVLLFYLTIQALSLPGAEEALRFIFYPKFDNVSWESLIQVIGHVFFTLSIGMATMTVYGSYLKEDVNIPAAGFRVTLLDIFISLFSGMIIFPIVFTAGHAPGADPSVLFKTVPLLFDSLRIGKFFGVAFFLCLYLAALGATIGLLEAAVCDLVDRRSMGRRRSSWMMVVLLSTLAFFPAFSSSLFRNIQYQGMSLLQLLDSILINAVLPLVGLGVALAIGFSSDDAMRFRYFRDLDSVRPRWIYRQWLFILKFVVPILIGVAMILRWVS